MRPHQQGIAGADGAARSRQCLYRAVLALAEHMPNLLDIRRRGDHEAFEAELVNRRRQAVSARTPINLTRNLQMPNGNRGSAIRHNRGNH
jgi:hypothetical protein